ncbi:sugar transferase [Labilibacter sediminis]|nr:sugar transferase [Labilibacter sediminis]
MKRIFDILASFFGLILISPILLVTAILIKIYMPGPVLFHQKRGGRHGKIFTIHKFRSMKVNSGGSTVSVKGESRITPLGAKLRKYKIDELPELWNVLVGDMSFVGPRPDMPEYNEGLKGDDRKILELRPGITGPATLKYANEEELLAQVDDPHKFNEEVLWPEKVRMNLEYYYKRNFFMDLSIIFRTVFR